MNRILFFVLVLLLLSACKEDQQETVAAKPIDVVVYNIVAKDTDVTFEFVGKTASSRKVEIRSRVEGFLEKRLYTEGEFVDEGEQLFQMDTKPFEVALNASKAGLAQQQARLQTASANLNRVRPLVKKKAVAQKELDDALGNYRASAAAVEVAKANVIQAELNLGYTHIYSPVKGLTSYAMQQEGAYIGIGTQALLTYVAQINPMRVEFSISENQMLNGQKSERDGSVIWPEHGNFDVEIILGDGTSYSKRGEITFKDASLSDETGTFLIRAEVDNSDKTLSPGQFVRVKLHGAQKANAILVPKLAVQQGAKGSFVWIINSEGKSEFRPVTVGRWKDDHWFIESGLKDGEKIVAKGGMKLRAGVALNEVPEKPEQSDKKNIPAKAE